jgi:hypothetical protein
MLQSTIFGFNVFLRTPALQGSSEVPSAFRTLALQEMVRRSLVDVQRTYEELLIFHDTCNLKV